MCVRAWAPPAALDRPCWLPRLASSSAASRGNKTEQLYPLLASLLLVIPTALLHMYYLRRQFVV